MADVPFRTGNKGPEAFELKKLNRLKKYREKNSDGGNDRQGRCHKQGRHSQFFFTK